MGQLVSTTDPLNRADHIHHRPAGRVAKVTNPDGGASTYTYDLAGDQLSSTDRPARSAPPHTTTSATPSPRRPRSASPAKSTPTTYAYASNGWLASTRSPAGVTTSNTYNAAGETVTFVDGAGQSTGYGYDGEGRRVRITRPDGTYTTTTYDRAGRAVGATAYDAAGTALSNTTAGYDADGARHRRDRRPWPHHHVRVRRLRAAGHPDRAGQRYRVHHHQLRVRPGRQPDRIHRRARQRVHDHIQQPQTCRRARSGRPPRTTAPHPTKATTTSYDAAGNATSVALPGGVSITNTYDAMNRLTGQSGAGAEVGTRAGPSATTRPAG